LGDFAKLEAIVLNYGLIGLSLSSLIVGVFLVNLAFGDD
jgi:hypothetical protein